MRDPRLLPAGTPGGDATGRPRDPDMRPDGQADERCMEDFGGAVAIGDGVDVRVRAYSCHRIRHASQIRANCCVRTSSRHVSEPVLCVGSRPEMALGAAVAARSRRQPAVIDGRIFKSRHDGVMD